MFCRMAAWQALQGCRLLHHSESLPHSSAKKYIAPQYSEWSFRAVHLSRRKRPGGLVNHRRDDLVPPPSPVQEAARAYPAPPDSGHASLTLTVWYAPYSLNSGLGPAPSFRSLSGRLKLMVRHHIFNEILSAGGSARLSGTPRWRPCQPRPRRGQPGTPPTEFPS